MHNTNRTQPGQQCIQISEPPPIIQEAKILQSILDRIGTIQTFARYAGHHGQADGRVGLVGMGECLSREDDG